MSKGKNEGHEIQQNPTDQNERREIIRDSVKEVQSNLSSLLEIL